MSVGSAGRSETQPLPTPTVTLNSPTHCQSTFPVLCRELERRFILAFEMPHQNSSMWFGSRRPTKHTPLIAYIPGAGG